MDVEHLSEPRRAGELAMLMLRLARGLDRKLFVDRTGRDAIDVFADVIDRLAPMGLVEVTDAAIRVTDAGLSVADSISAEFLGPAFPA